MLFMHLTEALHNFPVELFIFVEPLRRFDFLKPEVQDSFKFH